MVMAGYMLPTPYQPLYKEKVHSIAQKAMKTKRRQRLKLTSLSSNFLSCLQLDNLITAPNFANPTPQNLLCTQYVHTK